MSAIKPLLLLTSLLWAGWAQAIPTIETWQTENGAKVYFVAAQELPMVDVRVVFDAGSARDDGEPGRAMLTNALLAEGAGDLDADEIARRFEAVGANFANSSLRDMALVSLRSLTDPQLLNPALDTLALVLSRPSFPEGAFERERQRVLIALQGEAQSPAALAEKAFYAALYGDHPYASPTLGTPQSVRALTLKQLRTHYQRYYVGRNAVIAIVGDVDRAGAEAIANKVVGGLAGGQKAPPLPDVPSLAQSKRISLAHPSAQTHVLAGQPGITRDDPDYFPLYVGNHVLGGSGLVSRIADEIREKRGLSYSSYSYFLPMSKQGPFMMGLQTANRNTREALQVLDATLREFIAEGPTEAELKAAKQNITGGFPLRIDSNSKIVQYLAVIGFYGLPLNYLDTFNDRVTAVSAAQVRDAFQRRVDPAKLVTVTVGSGS